MNQSIIRGCSGGKKKKKVCGLLTLPDDVFVDCLVQLSRLDIVAIAMVSRRHRKIAGSRKLLSMRYQMGSIDPYVYVFMHMYPDPSPRWFVFHPVQRRLKRVHPSLCPAAPLEGSCFVSTESGIYTIGGLMDGKPTSEVTFLNCIDHKVCRVAPMNVARSGASASLIEDGKKKKIYVFGGCWDDDDVTANWVEVYDIETETWELLSVSTPKMPLRIKESMAMDEKHVHAVDEDGELFIFSTSECKFWAAAGGAKESDPENKNDWRLFGQTFFCRGVGGRILWRSPSDLDWKEVKGLEELRQQHIIKICAFSGDRMAIFWSQGPAYQTLELRFAEISLQDRWDGEEWDVLGNIEWSGAVFSDSSYTAFNLLFADSFYL